MRKLVAAAVAIAVVLPVALPTSSPVHADEPASVEVDETSTTPAPPDIEPAPEPAAEPEPEPEPEPQPELESAPEPEPESAPEPEPEPTNVEVVEDASQPVDAERAIDMTRTVAKPQLAEEPLVENPLWTEPIYPEQPQPAECTQQLIEKATSFYSEGVWSAWVDWPGVDPVWDDGRERTGHHFGTHGAEGDRHYAYIVVGSRDITTGECAPEVSVQMGEEAHECIDGVLSFVLEWTASTTAAGSYQIWVHNRSSAPTSGRLYESDALPAPGANGTVTIPATDLPLYDEGTGAVTIIATVADEQYSSAERTYTDVTECQPDPLRELSEWVDVVFVCGGDSVEQTRTVTTTPYVYSDSDREWVLDSESAVTEIESGSRDLDDGEVIECPEPPVEVEVVREVPAVCGVGVVEVTVTTTTTTSVAVWDGEEWEIDEKETVEQATEPLNEAEQGECQPDPLRELSEWVDVVFVCGGDSVEQTRTVTTTPYVYSDSDREWVLDSESAVTEIESGSRDLDDGEVIECPEPPVEVEVVREVPAVCGVGVVEVTVTTTTTTSVAVWDGEEWEIDEKETVEQATEPLNEAEQGECQPDPLRELSEWVDVVFVCGGDSVEQTRTVTTTPYVYSDSDREWVLDSESAVTEIESGSRDLDDGEVIECPEPPVEVEVVREVPAVCGVGVVEVTVTTTTTTSVAVWDGEEWEIDEKETVEQATEPLNEAEQGECQPDPLRELSEWVDVVFVCGGDSVEQTRTVTTTPYVYSDSDREWVLDSESAVTEIESGSRDLDDGEVIECPEPPVEVEVVREVPAVCGVGVVEVTVTTTTTTSVAVWDGEEWEIDEKETVEQATEPLNEAEQGECQPDPLRELSEWVDVVFVCGGDSVEQTRTVTTTPYVYSDSDREWVLDSESAVTEIESGSRDLDDGEVIECPEPPVEVEVVREVPAVCGVGVVEVTVTTTTTTSVAVWDGEEWEIDEKETVEQATEPLNEAEQGECQPDPLRELSEWVDVVFVCGGDSVEQTRTVTTTPYVYSDSDREWVLDSESAVTEIESGSRDLDDGEVIECPEPPVEVEVVREVPAVCGVGVVEVTVTTTTTTSVAVWDGEEWEIDEKETVEQATEPLNEAEQGECQPDPLRELSEWVDGEFDCDDTAVPQTRTVTTTPYVYVDREWVLDSESAVTEIESRSRDFDEGEQDECRPPPPVVRGEWVDGEFDCDDTAVPQTRTVTTTPYVYVDREWVLDSESAVTEIESRSRDFDEGEQDECRPPRPSPPPRVVVVSTPCGAGETRVDETTSTTTFRAVWNGETWRSVVDGVTAISVARRLTPDEQAACEPPEEVVTSEWVDGALECGETTVAQTRTETTTPNTYAGGEWVLDPANSTTVTETQIRNLDVDEIVECPVELDVTVSSECVDDVPWITWSANPPVGSPETATVSLFDTDGNPVGEPRVGLPLVGRILYPGASVDPPDWPGWALDDDGEWVVDPSDALLRNGIRVVVEVNPTGEGWVEYPPATPQCKAGPDVVVRSATWECAPGSEAPEIEYEVDVEENDASEITMRILDLKENLVATRSKEPLSGLVVFPDDLRTGGTLEFVIVTEGDVDIEVSTKASVSVECFPVEIDGLRGKAVLGDDESSVDSGCREEFSYKASFYRDPAEAMTDPDVEERTALAARDSKSQLEAVIELPDGVDVATPGDDRFVIDIDPGKLQHHQIKVEVDSAIRRIVVATLKVSSETGQGSLTIGWDEEPTILDPSCTEPVSGGNR